jgi:hypothetical protein
VWAGLAHGEVRLFARLARAGWATVTNIPHFPLLAWLAKGPMVLGGSAETWVFWLSHALCAAGFVGVYGVVERLRGAESARWGLALLAAFPFAYHLSDGGALAALVAFSSWGVWLALRGRWLAGAVVLSLGVLAHPACLAFVALAAQARGRVGRRVVFAVLPALVLGVWMFHLHRYYGPWLWTALWPPTVPLDAPWLVMAMVFGGVLVSALALMVFEPELRVFALAAAVQLVMLLWVQTPSAVHALAACWPAWLWWGELLARREPLRIPAVVLLATHQGLLFFCYVRFLPLT